MTDLLVVSNSSPLIALDQIGRLEILERLFSQIAIPEAVAAETAPISDSNAWIKIHSVTTRLSLGNSLGLGETEAISLALELGSPRIILDDLAARRQAQRLGLAIIGTLGILSAAKRKGIVSAMKPDLDALLAKGFHVGPALYKQVLLDSGENP